jgi:hypothetical protein
MIKEFNTMTGSVAKGGGGKGVGSLVLVALVVAGLYFGYKYIQKRNTIVVEED